MRKALDQIATHDLRALTLSEREPGPCLAAPRKVKSHTLSGAQRMLIGVGLLRLGQPKIAKQVKEAVPGQSSLLKEPSVFEFVGADGTAQRWILGNTLRSGSFGKFRIAISDMPERGPVQVLAVKEYRLIARKKREIAKLSAQGMDRPKTRYSTRAEIDEENALLVDSGSALRSLETVERDDRVYNFCELMRGDLYDVVTAKLTPEDRMKVTREIARSAMDQLERSHQAMIVHRDVKPENLLVDRAGYVHLADYNLATRMRHGLAAGAKGSPAYVAPEVTASRVYRKEVDLYSLGLSLAHASLGDYLLDGEQTEYFRDQVGGVSLSTLHEALGHMIERLRFEPDGRIEQTSLRELSKSVVTRRLPYVDAQARAAIFSAMGWLRLKIDIWNRRDPVLCGTALNFMLRRRCELHHAQFLKAMPVNGGALHEHFARLQPKDSPASLRAKDVMLNLFKEQGGIDDEIARLQVYARAYRM